MFNIDRPNRIQYLVPLLWLFAETMFPGLSTFRKRGYRKKWCCDNSWFLIFSELKFGFFVIVSRHPGGTIKEQNESKWIYSSCRNKLWWIWVSWWFCFWYLGNDWWCQERTIVVHSQQDSGSNQYENKKYIDL